MWSSRGVPNLNAVHVYAGLTLTVVVLISGCSPKQVDVVGDPTATKGRASNGGVAFASRGFIYVVSANGSEPRRIAQGSSPEWSPDGVDLAFLRDSGVKDVDGYPLRELVVVNADGSEPRVMTGADVGSVSHPHWSPDGTRFVVQGRPDESALWVMNADGSGDAVRIAEEGSEDAAWSPSSDKVAFYATQDQRCDLHICDIRVVNVDGSDLTTIAGGLGQENDPAWSPNGDLIAYVRLDGTIFLMDSDGAGKRRIATHVRWAFDPVWSPDATRILFSVYRRATYDIWVVNADGTGLKNLTGQPGDELAPTWSPDGTKIAYVAGKSINANVQQNRGSYRLYVMNADGSGKRRLNEDLRPQAHLSWQPLFTTPPSP